MKENENDLLMVTEVHELFRFINERVTPAAAGPQSDKSMDRSPARSAEERFENRVCDSVILLRHEPIQVQGRLIMDHKHPFFFDHPLDHVSGLQMVAAMRQLAWHGYISSGGLNRERNAFLSCVKISFNRFCQKNDEATLVRAFAIPEEAGKEFRFRGQVLQQNVVLSEGIFSYRLSRNDRMNHSLAFHHGSRGRVSGDHVPCDKEMVNKQNPANVFISGVSEVEGRAGCWLLPFRKGNGLVTLGNDGFYDSVYMVEACRQAHRAAEFHRRSRGDALDVVAMPDTRDLMIVLKSIELLLERPVLLDDSLRIEFRKDEMLHVGGSLLIKGGSTLVANGTEVGSFGIRTLVLTSSVYSRWRSDGIKSPLYIKSTPVS